MSTHHFIRVSGGLLLAIVGAVNHLSAAEGQTPGWGEQAVVRLAIETAATQAVEPIELRFENRTLLAVYDRFRLAALAARAAMADGHPLDPDKPPAELLKPRTVVIALSGSPLPDGMPAQSLEVRTRDGKAVKRLQVLKQEDISTWLPGVTVPGDAMAVAFGVPSLQPGDRIKLESSASHIAVGAPRSGVIVAGPSNLSVQFTPPEQVEQPPAIVPPGVDVPAGGAEVKVQGVLDLTGHVRYARALDGPRALHAAAEAAVGTWVYTPAKMWASPIPLVIQATIVFRSSPETVGASGLTTDSLRSRR